METPASVDRVQKAIESMMTEVQRTLLVPKQKEAFLCCAKCCDANSEPKEIQQCVENCSRPPMMQQKTIAHIMQDFQERFQRCALRCQDAANEVAGLNPTSSDESRAKDKFYSCMDGCGKEFEGKVPQLKKDVITQLKKL